MTTTLRAEYIDCLQWLEFIDRHDRGVHLFDQLKYTPLYYHFYDRAREIERISQ